MENLIRSARSGSDWTSHELAAYNITVRGETFFGRQLGSLNHNLMSTEDPAGATAAGFSDATICRFLI